MTMPGWRWWAAAACGAVALASTGCGGGGQGGAPGTLHLAAVPRKLAYDKSSLTAKPGKVTIVMTNPSSLPHDVAIEDGDVDAKGKVVGTGGTSTVTADLKAGTYTFYCSVPGHKQAGMKGKLTVE
ncbi:MAG: plastocyanin/azurin family copper-binding protein [Solirubrobacteraceae bacterium]